MEYDSAEGESVEQSDSSEDSYDEYLPHTISPSASPPNSDRSSFDSPFVPSQDPDYSSFRMADNNSLKGRLALITGASGG